MVMWYNIVTIVLLVVAVACLIVGGFGWAEFSHTKGLPAKQKRDGLLVMGMLMVVGVIVLVCLLVAWYWFSQVEGVF